MFDFDALSNYLIPKQQLGGRCITVTYKEVKVMGVPYVIEGDNYERNEFVFNVGFVCHKWSKTVRRVTCTSIILMQIHGAKTP